MRKAAEDITEEASGIQIKTERLHKSVGSEGGGGASWGLFLFSADLSPSESDLQVFRMQNPWPLAQTLGTMP